MNTCFAIGATILAVPFIIITGGCLLMLFSRKLQDRQGVTGPQTLGALCLVAPVASLLSALSVWLWQLVLA